jgi:NAD(P)-dependent dehydrogenase (short-subunit alcohol dehydrogenase family)
MAVRFDFNDKNVLVIGGTSGINLGIAEAYAASGAQLGVAGRKQEKIDAALPRLSRHGKEAVGYSLDVRDPEAVADAIARFAQRFGPIDVLVSGAAGNFPARATDLSPNGFRAVVEIDLLGTFHVMRAAYAHLVKPGACVINISAPQAFIASPMQVHVCAAKAGVDMITRTLAIEWGPDGVRINSVTPGPIDGTEGMQRLAPTEAIRKKVVESVPMRRMGTPDDVAQVCLFLASDAGRYVSGTVIPVDGAWSTSGASLQLS